MTTATLTKLDLYKEHAADYATPRKPILLNIAPAKYLTIEGAGRPGGDDFQQKIGALYTMAFTIKMASKFAGQDYTSANSRASSGPANAAPISSKSRRRNGAGSF